MEVISSLQGFYDLVFFDAQKDHYYKQLKSLISKKLIGKGTLILADNVIDRQTECQPFLDWFKINEMEHQIIPTECGLLIAQL
jgi:predicted O-methyltransferase YrrM